MLNLKDSFTHTDGVDFPNTTSKDSSGGGSLDGTHFNKSFIDDLWGFMQACLSQASLMPSGVNESSSSSQILAGIIAIVLNHADSSDVGNVSSVGAVTDTTVTYCAIRSTN